MKRNQMLEYLHNITFWACATTFTMDMGLEYDYANNEGYGSSLGSMGSWPIHVIGAVDSDKLINIKKKIAENSLTMEDLEGTGFHDFAEALSEWHPKDFTEHLSLYFKSLINIPDDHSSDIFVFSDFAEWSVEVEFYSDGESLKRGFAQKCDFGAYETWEDLDDEDLEEWVDRIKDNPIY